MNQIPEVSIFKAIKNSLRKIKLGHMFLTKLDVLSNSNSSLTFITTSSHGSMPPKRRPNFKITRWMRVKYRIRSRLANLTPWRLRGSVVRLRHTHSHPYLALLKLFIMDLRMPSWNWSYDFSLPEPLAPKDIADNEGLFYRHHPDIFSLRYIPIWAYRDTPLRAVYRLYEVFMTREFVLLRLDCEYFWRHASPKWALASIPDPCDSEPIRYAMLASIVEELVVAFNWRLSLGMRRNRMNIERSRENPNPPFVAEETPSWTARVPPIQQEWLRELPADMVQDGKLVLEEGGCDTFDRWNWDAPTRYLYTI